MRPRVDTRARLYVLGGVLGLAATSLVVRAVDLQLIDNEFYQQQGDARFLRELPIPTSRGMITDRHGEPLAVSSPVESIWANPKALLAHPEQMPELAAALDIDLEVLTQRLAERSDREFVFLRRHLNPDQAEDILALDAAGVFSQREFRRFYPLGEVTAHVLGFTNIDDRGQEGLELAFDDWLNGKPGAKRVIRDRRGRVVENVDLIRPAQAGRTLTLSIDRRIQYLAYRELAAALLEHDASSGSVVILEVKTGEILAMVNQPSYNPNARDNATSDAQRNRALTDVFEPGSVFKTFTVAAGLESGKFTPTSQFDAAPMVLHGHRIADIHDYGIIDTTRILTKSSNVGATKISLELTAEHMHDLLSRFGFGQPTRVGFPGEAAGVLPAPDGWGTVEKATISYGYGISVTALQLAQAYAAIGHGGVLVQPTFVHAPERQGVDGRGSDDRAVENPGRAVIDPQLAAQLMTMLETVTGSEGTAARAAVAGFRSAGKTGTSRKAAAGGYQRRYISLFAGLIPASDPRFAMVVMINDPSRSAYYGGAVAAPVFGRVMAGALRVMDVAPDNIGQLLAAMPELVVSEGDDVLPAEAEPVADAIALGGVGE